MKFDPDPFRPVYEAGAALAWILAWAGIGFWIASTGCHARVYAIPLLMVTGAALGMGHRAWSRLAFKASLKRFYLAFIRPAQLRWHRIRCPGEVFIGYGFDWQPRHTACLLHIQNQDETVFTLPDWYAWLKVPGLGRVNVFRWIEKWSGRHTGLPAQKKSGHPEARQVGKPWLHAMEPDERHLYVPDQVFEGHTLVLGTTGSGKTRWMELMLFQSVLRGDVVYIIDPKGDQGLCERARQSCIDCGRQEAFLFFHPAFPERSIRLDPLRNWTRMTQVASRLAALLPVSNETGDPFTGFAWDVLNSIVGGCVYLLKRPTLTRLRQYVINGPDHLMKQVLEKFFDEMIPGWKDRILADSHPVRPSGKTGRRQPGLHDEILSAYMDYYRSAVPEALKVTEVNALLALTEHNREHLGKMLSALVPILSQLTTDPLHDLLSPDVEDIHDPRPIFDTWKFIQGGHVVYVGLDSLSDKTVGAAIGSLLLADLASVAGAIYNYGPAPDSVEQKQVSDPGLPARRIKVFVDEAAECINGPLIQLLNKGRGAHFELEIAMQTLADLSAALGGEERARMVLGNCNNLIAFRSKDGKTQQYIVENFGQTAVAVRSESRSVSQRSGDWEGQFSGHAGLSFSESRTDRIPAATLGDLPDLHYFASVAGGRIIKGRIPIVSEAVFVD
ncbi:MAG: conjugative transfer system coupling protein TraD [Pseudomonadota bacterium]|nr:conjugative transfer system coupling protein TraD [Pseudomonadota bacterium]